MSFQPPVCLEMAFPGICGAFPCCEQSLRAGWELLLFRAELPGGIAGGGDDPSMPGGFVPLPARAEQTGTIPQLLARGAGFAGL